MTVDRVATHAVPRVRERSKAPQVGQHGIRGCRKVLTI